MGEIAENCQGVKLVLVALKCDLREQHSEEEEDVGDQAQAQGKEGKEFIDYKQGLEVAERIQALRYLGEIGSHPAVLVNKHANFSIRVLCQEESWRERSIHRSCSSSISRQGSRRFTR